MPPTKANPRKLKPYLSHPDVAALVLPLLTPGEKKYLRSVCRRIRDAVDKHWVSVTVKCCRDWNSAQHLTRDGARFSGLRHINLVALDINNALLRPICAVQWPNLESIELGDNALTARAGRILAGAATAWPALVSLNLANNTLGDEGVEALTAANWPQLAELNLSYNGLTAAAGTMLARAAPRWPLLRVLNLEENALGPIGIKNLGTAHFYELEELRLGGNSLGFVGMTHLGGAAKDANNHWPSLKILDLSGCGIGPEPAAWVDAFFQGQWDRLEELILKDNAVGGEGAASLGIFGWRLPRLRRLVLDGAQIHEQGLKILFSSPWHALEDLSLAGVRAIGKGAKALGDSAVAQHQEDQPRMPRLRRLNLTNSGCHNEALKALIAHGWRHLEFLNLKGCGLGFHGMGTLGRQKEGKVHLLPALTELWVSSTPAEPLTSKALAKLFEFEWPALERVRVNGLDASSRSIGETIRNIRDKTGIRIIREGALG